MSALVVDDEVVHYEVLGRGRPLIFVHGWVGSWRYWIPTMQALSADYRAYAVDLWGFGDSGKDPRRYSLAAQAGLLHSFLEHLGIAKAAFVGHGLGSAVALQFAVSHAGRADRLMSVCAPASAAAINPRLQGGPLAGLVEWLLGRGPGVEPISQEAAKADPLALEAGLNDVLKLNLSAQLAAAALPCLLVHGDKDPLIASPEPGWLASQGAAVHAIGLEESRHFPMLDEAVRFNRLLGDFLALKPGEALTNLELKEEWRRRVR